MKKQFKKSVLFVDFKDKEIIDWTALAKKVKGDKR